MCSYRRATFIVARRWFTCSNSDVVIMWFRDMGLGDSNYCKAVLCNQRCGCVYLILGRRVSSLMRFHSRHAWLPSERLGNENALA